MRLSDIYERQRHENKCLQGDDQNVENRPSQTGNQVEHK